MVWGATRGRVGSRRGITRSARCRRPRRVCVLARFSPSKMIAYLSQMLRKHNVPAPICSIVTVSVEGSCGCGRPLRSAFVCPNPFSGHRRLLHTHNRLVRLHIKNIPCPISSLDTELSLRHRIQNCMKLRRDTTRSCRAHSPALHVGRRDRVA